MTDETPTDPDIDEAIANVRDTDVDVALASDEMEDIVTLLEELRLRRRQIREAIEGPPKPKRRPEGAWWLEKEHQVEGSSNIRAARYRTGDKLEVAFNGGGVYRYNKVPRAVWEAFMNAESKGRFLNQMIKPMYDGVKVISKP